MSEPLSEKELAAIRERSRNRVGIDIPTLLDEIDRLRAKNGDVYSKLMAQGKVLHATLQENAAMRPIVEAVAHASQPFGAQPGSGVEILYARTGTQEQARALLAKEE